MLRAEGAYCLQLCVFARSEAHPLPTALSFCFVDFFSVHSFIGLLLLDNSELENAIPTNPPPPTIHLHSLRPHTRTPTNRHRYRRPRRHRCTLRHRLYRRPPCTFKMHRRRNRSRTRQMPLRELPYHQRPASLLCPTMPWGRAVAVRPAPACHVRPDYVFVARLARRAAACEGECRCSCK